MFCHAIVGYRMFVAGRVPWFFARFRCRVLWFGFIWVSSVNFALRGDGHVSIFVVAGRRHVFRRLGPASTHDGDFRPGVDVAFVCEVGDLCVNFWCWPGFLVNLVSWARVVPVRIG